MCAVYPTIMRTSLAQLPLKGLHKGPVVFKNPSQCCGCDFGTGTANSDRMVNSDVYLLEIRLHFVWQVTNQHVKNVCDPI